MYLSGLHSNCKRTIADGFADHKDRGVKFSKVCPNLLKCIYYRDRKCNLVLSV